jgi:hypothetical protein
MSEQLGLGFTGRPRTMLMRRLGAMVAPIATDSGAIVDDESIIDIARAVCEAFGHKDAAGGLTKAEIASRVAGVCSAAELESRLGVFIRMELLRPALDKQHQQRYVLASSGLVGMLVVDRFTERGGVEELLGLLDRTKRALASGHATERSLSSSVRRFVFEFSERRPPSCRVC